MKTLLLTISTAALLLVGQSAMAFEQVNSENGYDAAYQNGWVSASTAANLDMLTASHRSQPSSTGFEQINSENGYDSAYRNGWVSPDTVAHFSMNSVKASFRTDSVDMRGQFEDSLSINYISTK